MYIEDKLNDYITKNMNIDEYLLSFEEGIQLYLLLSDLTTSLKEYFNTILKNTSDIQIINRALLSILHMRYNRLIGIDRKKENEIMRMIEKLIYKKNARMKYYGYQQKENKNPT